MVISPTLNSRVLKQDDWQGSACFDLRRSSILLRDDAVIRRAVSCVIEFLIHNP